jgi:hypothetical protein
VAYLRFGLYTPVYCIRQEYEEICLAIVSVEVSLPRSRTAKLSEYGFVASITILLVKVSKFPSSLCYVYEIRVVIELKSNRKLRESTPGPTNGLQVLNVADLSL